MQARLLRAGEVAVLLSLASGRSFLARRARLEDQGFPPRVAGQLLDRWDRVAIERWLDGRLMDAPASHMQAEDTLIKRARAMGAV